MAIPKVIYQTFKTNDIPWLTKYYIRRFMKKNPGYIHEFYDDERIDKFFENSFDMRICRAYRKLQIGAAKADFFRYAALYKKGGIYLDLDSDILTGLDKYLKADDVAIITREAGHRRFYAQWALIFDREHPFLERVIEYVVENIEQNKFPHDVHSMTGPSVYSRAINDVIAENPDVAYRIVPDDYHKMMKFKYKLNKLLIYGDKSNHWKKLQQRITVIKEE
jgi:mannosyltransferase OCH1-like enzyme